MDSTAIERLITHARAAWSAGLTAQALDALREHMGRLAREPSAALGLAGLDARAPASETLHEDAEHGFILLAHSVKQGCYRPPHDHGDGWVIYAVHQGEVDMGTYGFIGAGDNARLVRRDVERLRRGAPRLFLRGDVHDTRSVSETAVMLRLTSCDLAAEFAAGRMIRYRDDRGTWVAEALR